MLKAWKAQKWLLSESPAVEIPMEVVCGHKLQCLKNPMLKFTFNLGLFPTMYCHKTHMMHLQAVLVFSGYHENEFISNVMFSFKDMSL